MVPNWPKLLSLAVHEFSTPVTVVSGYLRMLLRDRAGPLADNQRRLLEEAEKSCGRLSALIGEVSELGQLHDGRQALAPGSADLGELLRSMESAATEDGQSAVHVAPIADRLVVEGDANRLRRAFEAIVFALRREIIDGSELVISAAPRPKNGGRVAWIALGGAPLTAALVDASADALGPFDEWRGGCGLTLPLARRVIEMHGGRLLALTGERQKTGGVIELPLS
jgi:signal transduction histidine kinase